MFEPAVSIHAMARSISLEPWTKDGVESVVKMEKAVWDDRGWRRSPVRNPDISLSATTIPPPMEEEPYATRVLSTACRRPDRTRVTVANGGTI